MAQLILGVDEGTTAVKATLFDERLRPVREARRDKVNRHPQPGWVEQDGEEVLRAVVEAVGEVLEHAPGEVVACGLDHQGESVLAWDAESGSPLTPIVVWSDKRSQEILDRVAGDEERIRARSGLPLDPYFSAGKLAWLLEHDDAVARARARRDAAHGDGRLVPVRSARRRLRDRRLDGVPDAAPRPRHPGLRPVAVPAVRRAARRAARGAPERGGARRPAPRAPGRSSCGCAARWSTSRRRSRARAA